MLAETECMCSVNPLPLRLSLSLCLMAYRNSVPFTPTQVEAIRAGMHPGLTMIVGPPGTGKTDVAVQIISNLYHSYPDQRTLLVTHSNQVIPPLPLSLPALKNRIQAIIIHSSLMLSVLGPESAI